jgi:hypothetical protein
MHVDPTLRIVQYMCNAKQMQRHLEFGEWGLEIREIESDM